MGGRADPHRRGQAEPAGRTLRRAAAAAAPIPVRTWTSGSVDGGPRTLVISATSVGGGLLTASAHSGLTRTYAPQRRWQRQPRTRQLLTAVTLLPTTHCRSLLCLCTAPLSCVGGTHRGDLVSAGAENSESGGRAPLEGEQVIGNPVGADCATPSPAPPPQYRRKPTMSDSRHTRIAVLDLFDQTSGSRSIGSDEIRRHPRACQRLMMAAVDGSWRWQFVAMQPKHAS